MINHLLLRATKEGNEEDLEAALAKGAFLETRRPFLMTPESSAEQDTILVLRGVGLTPLMYASQAGYTHIVLRLIKAGAEVNAEEEDGLRPLHFAASAGEL